MPKRVPQLMFLALLIAPVCPLRALAFQDLSPAAPPTFSPPSGVYTFTTNIVLTSATPAAAIYFTTDGTAPTTSSKVYTRPVPISATTVIRAIAAAPGLDNSPIATAIYTIQPIPGNGPGYVTGFDGNGLTLNGNATYSGNRLRLTTSAAYQRGSAFFNTPVNSQTFITDFSFQLTNAVSDGFTFCIQNDPAGLNALGGTGGGLGYSDLDPPPGLRIINSVAIKFDLHNNQGEGENSTGLFTNGQWPTVPALDLTRYGINLHSGKVYNVHVQYSQPTLYLLIVDAADATKTFATTFNIDIPATVGANTAYAGFTAGTGGGGAYHEILSWNYVSTYPPVAFSAFGVTLVLDNQPPYGFQAQATFALGPGSNGIDPVNESITIGMESLGVVIAPGSFQARPDGSFSFTGKVADLPLRAVIAPVAGQPGTYVAGALAGGINLTGQPNPARVSLRIGDDAARRSVTWTLPPQQ